MDGREFTALLERRLTLTQRVLGTKAAEYATDRDRLHNFNTAAKDFSVTGETPAQCLWGMARKHVVSIQDMIEQSARGKVFDIAVLDEKIGDAINYLILLEGILQEERVANVKKADQDNPE